MDDQPQEPGEGIRFLMRQGNIGQEEAQRLYGVLERNDWCVLHSGHDLVICTASNLRGPDVAHFPDWPNLMAWLQEQAV